MKDNGRNNNMMRPFFRGLPVIILTATLCILMARWYLKHTIPMYESTAKIRLADPHTGEASSNLYKDLDVFSTNNQIGTEVEMVKAKVLIEKTLDSLNMQTIVYRTGKLIKKELYHDNPLKVTIRIKDEEWYGKIFNIDVVSGESYLIQPPGGKKYYQGYFDRPLVLSGADVLIGKNQDLLDQRSKLPLAGKYAVITYSRDQAVDKIIGNLDITSIDKDVPILRIIYKSAVPEKAAEYVNILANAYISDYVETKVKAANITVAFLDRQLADVGKRLSHSEDTIEQFRNDENIINIHQETETDLRKIAQLKIQMANMKMSLSAIDTLNRYMQDGKGNFLELAPNFEAFTDLLSTELIKKLKQLQSDKKDLLLQYTEEEEKVKVIDAKIKDIKDYLLESIRNTRNNYAIKYREMAETVSESEKVFIGLPTREKNINILERSFGLNEKIYSYLHQKRTEAQIARAATVSFHRIVAHGESPEEPVSPNKVVITAVAAILGLLGSTILVYAVHGAKGKVNNGSSIQRRSETPLAAEVSMQRKDKERQKHFNDLAIGLELQKLINYPSVVAYSSFEDKEGKAYNAVNISRSLVSLGRKTLLFDVGSRVTMPDGADVDHYKAQEETEDGVVIRHSVAEKLLEWKKQYDVIVICNDPISLSANALVYMSLADVNLFVLDARRTAARMIVEADVLKETFHIPNMYFVLNRAHYNPSLLVEGVAKVRNLIGRLRNKKMAGE